MVKKYAVTKNDWVIGHSPGGWIGLYMKKYCDCRIVQIASRTNFDRVVSPVRNGKIIYWLIKNKLYLNKFQKWLEVRKYKGLPSEQIFTETFDNLLNNFREAAIKQLRLLFEPAPITSILPELRIHARVDPIIKPRVTSFHEVPGDHFSIVTFPEAVLAPLLAIFQ